MARERDGNSGAEPVTQVFLGGSCNPTVWRTEVAIPIFEKHGIGYYNPQVDDWTPDLARTESLAKEQSSHLLFVIDKQTRAMASIVEATEYICRGKNVVLVVIDVEEGAMVASAPLGKGETKDLNRMREYLRELAERHAISVHTDIGEACASICRQQQQHCELPAPLPAQYL